MTQDTNNILEDLTRQMKAADEEYQTAEKELYSKQEEINSRPQAPGTSYQEFLDSYMPEKPTTVVDPKKEKSRMMVSNIGDAINAIGGIVGAGIGADVAPMASLSAANQARHDKLIAQRKAEQDAYNRGAMQAHSFASSMSDWHDKQRAREEAKELAPYENRLRQAKTRRDIVGDQYSKAYKENRDVVGDEKGERSEERADTRLQRQLDNSIQTQQNANRREIRLHNDAERKRYESVPIGEYYPLKGQTNNLYVDIYDTIKDDPAVKAAIGATDWETIKTYEGTPALASDANAMKVNAIKKLLKRDPDSDVYKKAMDAVGKSAYAGQPDIWADDYFDTDTPARGGTTPPPADGGNNGDTGQQGSTSSATQLTAQSVGSAPNERPTWVDHALGFKTPRNATNNPALKGQMAYTAKSKKDNRIEIPGITPQS